MCYKVYIGSALRIHRDSWNNISWDFSPCRLTLSLVICLLGRVVSRLLFGLMLSKQ